MDVEFGRLSLLNAKKGGKENSVFFAPCFWTNYEILIICCVTYYATVIVF